MFYSFAKTESQFHKEKKSNLILIVSLANRKAVFFYNDFTFYYVNLDDMKCLYQGQLKGRVYKGVAISSYQILVSVIQTKSFIKIDLQKKTSIQIFKMTSPLNYNFTRQKQKFFLSTIQVFKQSSSFYIRQQIQQQRKFRLHFFMQKDKNQYQLRQFPSKDYLIQKLDEDSAISVFNQIPQSNGVFEFSQFSLKNREIDIKYRLESDVFISYCSVLQIKKLKNNKFLIGVNSNQKHHLLIFNKLEVNSNFYQSKQLLISSILINNEQNFGIFMFTSHQNPNKNDIRMLNLQNGSLICQESLQIKQYSVSFNNNYFLNYLRQIRPTTETYIYTIHLIEKKTHFMKMLQKLGVNQNYGSQLSENIINFLK